MTAPVLDPWDEGYEEEGAAPVQSTAAGRPTDADASPLSHAHQAELESSCIGPEHAAARGYRTLYGSDEDLAELRDLRIPRWMWREATAFPGLLIPEYRATGELIGYQWKPAVPQRNAEGKNVKYTSQTGTPNHIDIPPLVAADVRDPKKALWITEGVKKADSLASLGKAVVTLTGVFNWRSKLGTLGDWEDIPLKGRTVVVCFDADAREKRTVLLAMVRLGRWLTSKGAADVRYLITPDQVAQEDGPPVPVKGVDDYFRAGGTLEELGAFATREEPGGGAQDASFSDAVMADTVCSEELEGAFRWSAGLGWMTWTGKVWRKATDATVTEAVRLWALSQFQRVLDRQRDDPNRDMKSQIDGWKTALGKAKLNALVALSRGILESDPGDFDADPDAINCPNGIVDLRTGAIVPHDPDRLMTKITGVDYVKGAENADWFKALEALPEDVRPWFQARLGQAITGHLTPDDLAVICQGGGENGKSTVFNALLVATGLYHIMVADRAMLGNASDNHPTEMMDFRGARLAMLEETPEERHLDTNRLKKLVGTREITARGMRQDDVTFETTHSLFVNTNFEPQVNETDHGTWRRLALLKFPYTYRKTADLVQGPNDRLGDPTLRQRIESVPAMEAALAWAVEGAQRWYAADRIMPELPDRVAADTLEWRQKSDPILKFANESLEFDRDSHITGAELTDAFMAFLEAERSKPWSAKTFVSRFAGHDVCSRNGVGYKLIKARPGRSTRKPGLAVSASYKAWLGVRFSTPDDLDLSTDVNESPFQPNEDPFGDFDKPQVKGGEQDQVTSVTSPTVKRPSTRESALNLGRGYWGYRNDVVSINEDQQEAGMSEMSESKDLVFFDLEGASADELFTYGDDGGDPPVGFIRLAGAAVNDGEVRTGVPLEELVPMLEDGRPVGHNILGFDGLALAFHHGMDWERFCAGAVDTELKERLADPPMSKETGGSEDRYDLDHTAAKLGVRGKTDSVNRLKQKYGGYDKIPVDDPEYHAYLKGDVEATRSVASQRPMTGYAKREHLLASLAGRMTLNGCRVDVSLLRKRMQEGQAKKRAAMEELAETTGLPLGRTVMRGRSGAKVPVFEPFSSPFNTTEGKEWLADLWRRHGVVKPPMTSPTEKNPAGQLSTAAEALKEVADHPKCPAELKHTLELMGIITTTRTVYQTAATYMTADGRVHPVVSMRQSSGRWSLTKPGLTVFGKRGGRHVEREIIIPERGHVIITCDLSQVDMRGVAAHCQDPAYMALFAPGQDVHSAIGGQLGMERQDAKAFGHGYNYGLSLGGAIRRGADPELAKVFYQGMASQFPVKEEWTKKIQERGRNGDLLDNGFGRLMRCDPDHAFTVAPALMGQGSARDITMEVLLRLIAEHPEYRQWLRIYVHDEFVFSVPETMAEEVGAEIERAFTWEWNGVPILCDRTAPADNWGAASIK